MKRNLLLIVTALLAVAHFSVFAQGETENPIDVEMKACLDNAENQTTSGMTRCVLTATDKWDKELNKNYNLLVNKINKEAKSKLKASQVNWLKYRDTELAFSNDYYLNMKGTMWQNVAAMRKLEIIKQRAMELKGYVIVQDEE